MLKKIKNKIIAFVLIISLSFSSYIYLPFTETAVNAAMQYSTPNPSDEQWDCASKIYSVFKAIGWNDYQISGALGNMWGEGGLDYTSVETIYNEPFQWGPKKQQAESVDFVSALIPSFAAAYGTDSDVVKAGLGLIGFSDIRGSTRPSNTELREYAASFGTTFYANIDIQLQFLIDEENGYSGAVYIRHWEDYTHDTYNGRYFTFDNINSATEWFCHYIEGWYGYEAIKKQYAQWWYQNLPLLTYDQVYANNILSCTGSFASGSGDWGNPDFTGWDREDNQQTASYSYSMSEWDIFTDYWGFLYDIEGNNFISIDIDDWEYTEMASGRTIYDYCMENFGSDNSDGSSSGNFGPLVMVIAYVLNQRGEAQKMSSKGGLFTQPINDNAADIAYTKSFLGFDDSATTEEESLNRVYMRLTQSMNKFNSSSAYSGSSHRSAILFHPDEYLETVVQGVLYGDGFVSSNVLYSEDVAKDFYKNHGDSILSQIKEIKQWYTFADEVMTHYTAVNIEENFVYG